MAFIPGFNEEEKKIYRAENPYLLLSAQAIELEGFVVNGKKQVRIKGSGKIHLDLDDLSVDVRSFLMTLSFVEKK